jgi:hypothetical protein
MTESPPENPKKPRRRHSPSAATIIKAALAAGGTVTFENGVATVKPAIGTAAPNGNGCDANEWINAKPM